MVNLGPQLVQLMNGYPNRRSAGSDSSRRQSAHVAVSADTSVRRGPADSLAAMAKDADPLGVRGLVVTRSILASGGASRSSSSRNSPTAAEDPSTSTNTPPTSLPTSPLRPSPVARV